MPPFGTEDRQLFETAASRLFEEIAARGGVPADDPLLTASPEATDLLCRLGLLVHDRGSGRQVVVDPHTVQGSVVSPLGLQGAQLIAESSQWASAFSTLGQAYRRSPSTEDGPITVLSGDQIDRFLEDLVPGAQTELLTAQPQAGRSAKALRAAAARDVEALQRGVSMRTIYQHSARRSTATRSYVAAVTENGAEVRTLDEFFNRLIVVDREVAIIPSGDNLDVALAIRDGALVAYLVDIFERFWDRGRPFTSRSASTLSSIAEEQRAMTIRMLIEGHGDATCAKRLGVSPRTYAGYVADLKEEYDAQTRFQLGYRMGQAGAEGARVPEEG
ncbi:LuxR family transcriptional regulator [Nocardioides donggukensis]|uniref:LuxR family transcriptional regulator n=1 Tax=Nocardioides donggukensis TaxID=2774019 RepID=A0A927K3K6_9ACTN|nr:LuxR family transcriptional regulator [Nocardioides donggukensis]MBD8868118.1 LuxR family transcriptional regulator [Nocardioides donggukensis]